MLLVVLTFSIYSFLPFIHCQLNGEIFMKQTISSRIQHTFLYHNKTEHPPSPTPPQYSGIGYDVTQRCFRKKINIDKLYLSSMSIFVLFQDFEFLSNFLSLFGLEAKEKILPLLPSFWVYLKCCLSQGITL